MIHFEKSYRACGAKSALKSGKLGAFVSLVLNMICKSISENSIGSFKNASLKLTHTVSAYPSQADENTSTFSADLELTSEGGRSPKMAIGASSLPLADTDLTLSLASKDYSAASRPTSITDYVYSTINGISSDKSLGQWVPQGKKDEMLLKLVPRVPELQTQMQEWTEWAQQKVMQAARRLRKDKAELKSLRQEKEEVARLKKEKQNLEENNMKKLIEMENTLCTTSEKVKFANDAVHRLEQENLQMRQELEAAKVRAAESAASCQEITKREMRALKKFQSWEKQNFYQEELVNEKRKLSHLQQRLEHANDMQNQLEVKPKQEKDVKYEALAQADSERKEREQIEASAKLKEDMIRIIGETDLESFRDEIRKFENEIMQTRLKNDSSKIVSLKWGLDGSCVSLSQITGTQNLSRWTLLIYRTYMTGMFG